MEIARVTRAGALAGLLFLLLAGVTTQVKSIRAVLPFGDDPYDAVTSFGIIAFAIVGGATVIRWLAHARRAHDPAVERRIAVGAAIVTVITAVGIASDAVALVVVGVPAADAGVILTLTLIGCTAVAAAIALACIWKARSGLLQTPQDTDAEPDLIDDVGVIAGSLGAAGIADRLSRWVETSRFSPRRHRVLAGLLAAALAGVAGIVWHAFREGAWASPAAAAVFGGLMALGVIGAYLIGLEPLRLIRTPGA